MRASRKQLKFLEKLLRGIPIEARDDLARQHGAVNFANIDYPQASAIIRELCLGKEASDG